MLRGLALQEGVEIRQNANVVEVDADPVSVRLETGDIISGDIIVLANGCSSKLRDSVTGYSQDPPLETARRVLFVSFTVDISLLKDDESYRGVLESTNVRFSFILMVYLLHPHFSLVGDLDSRRYHCAHLCRGKPYFQSKFPCVDRFFCLGRTIGRLNVARLLWHVNCGR